MDDLTSVIKTNDNLESNGDQLTTQMLVSNTTENSPSSSVDSLFSDMVEDTIKNTFLNNNNSGISFDRYSFLSPPMIPNANCNDDTE